MLLASLVINIFYAPFCDWVSFVGYTSAIVSKTRIVPGTKSLSNSFANFMVRVTVKVTVTVTSEASQYYGPWNQHLDDLAMLSLLACRMRHERAVRRQYQVLNTFDNPNISGE